MDRELIERAAEVARAAVAASAKAAMPYFRSDLVIEKKPDRSPVTQADKDSEAAILATIRATFPDHAILAEESGEHAGSAESRWIVDPLDGTRGFSRGGTFWGPLVALEHRGRVVAGAMAMPALGVSYWAGLGLGAFRDGVRLSVSRVSDWEESTLSLGEAKFLLDPAQAWRREGVLALTTSAASMRDYGDLAACAMVLEGRAEAWLEAGVQPWDLAPLVILIEEAGGRFTDFHGNPGFHGGNAVATNGLVHDHVLRTFQR